MNESPPKIGRYAVIGIVVFSLLIILGWFAFRQEPPPPDQQPAKVEAVKPVAPVSEPTDDSSSEMPTNQPDNSVTTNAADLYRQAFALYDALTNDEKNILSDWQTNVDASVEAELCEKLRPICDLMHQASAVTNCDWGDKRLTFDDSLGHHLGPSRGIARAALWSAAHCRSKDAAGATDDTLAVLRLGQQVSQGAMIGSLVGIAIQQMAASYVAQNLGSFQGADVQRLAAAFGDPAYEELPSRALEEEADMVDRTAAKQATTAAANGYATNADQAGVFASYKQVADSERKLAQALATSSEDEHQIWQELAKELEAFGPLVKLMFDSTGSFLDKVQVAEINRSLVVAGLAVAQGGTDALQSNPDPSSGQPFTYTKTADGFQLQSTYQMDGKPMTMEFK